MTAKEYLGQAYRLDQRINTKLQQVDSLRSLTRRVTASFDGEVVSHARNVHSLQDAILHLMEAEEELNHQIDELVRTKVDIGATIEMVRNESFRLILEKRYLCFLTWDQIASDMNYSRRWVLNRHDKAVDVVAKILEEKAVSV